MTRHNGPDRDPLACKSIAQSGEERSSIRGQFPGRPGRFGDGIIGGRALESGFPIVTNDKALAEVISGMGGVVR